MRAFYGKYRGTVTGNTDPRGQNRIRVSCPAVLGDGRTSWALPCVPYAGDGLGLALVPPIGTQVWVEFEGGHPDHPIWSGCFWGRGQAPRDTEQPSIKVLRTEGLTLTIDDTPGSGSVSLVVDSPAVPAPLTIRCSATGIELVNGNAKVTLTAATVSVNNGALEVM
ncbi:phage baseplate assembly protein V [Cryptosporangium sp. NPDC048952]|uniref:phage baseplate assembly protein V n=1 Tax=Cryptosporangium sp. NPDC048952 TaxID=3363961 RepID=UPI00370FE7E2